MSKPQKQFRGWFIPAELVKLFEQEKLNANELILLATIDSLVSEEKGCYASNEFLSEKTRISVSTITHMITKFKKAGLVKQVAFDGRIRYLETVWARIDLNKATGFVKNKVKKGKKKIRLANSGESGSPPAASPNRVYNTTNRSIEKKSLSRGSASSNGQVPKSNLDKFCDDWSIIIRRMIKEVFPTNRLANCKVVTLSKDIRKLILELKEDREDINKVFEWFTTVENMKGKFTPKLRRSGDLYEYYHRIEEAMEKQQDKLDPEEKLYRDRERNKKLIDECWDKLVEAGWGRYSQPPSKERLDEILVELGYNPGDLDWNLL